MSRSMGGPLLWTFAVCLVLATILALALGFDLLVPQPDIPETLDLPGRLEAIQPFRQAQWPYDAGSNLLFVAGFAALLLAASPIASLAGDDRRAGVLKSAIQASGLMGAAAGLLYLGATRVSIELQYCDCGFKTQEIISQFWAIEIVQGATEWLFYGAIGLGAVGVALSALVLGGRGFSPLWRWISWSAAGFLLLSIVLHEVSDTPAGDLLSAVASGLLLPAWAIVLASRIRVIEADSEAMPSASD